MYGSDDIPGFVEDVTRAPKAKHDAGSSQAVMPSIAGPSRRDRDAGTSGPSRATQRDEDLERQTVWVELEGGGGRFIPHIVFSSDSDDYRQGSSGVSKDKGKGKGKGKGKAKEGEEIVEEDETVEEDVSLWSNTGIGQLYRGIWMRVGATILISQ